MKKDVRIIELQHNGDDRGSLVVLEESKAIPFQPRRLFYTYGVKDGKSRGNHANINSEFVMVALSGSVKISVDDGKEKYEFVLDDPTKALYIPNLTWKSMSEYTEDAILLVIASTLYDKEEYINDYDSFIEYVTNKK